MDFFYKDLIFLGRHSHGDKVYTFQSVYQANPRVTNNKNEDYRLYNSLNKDRLLSYNRRTNLLGNTFIDFPYQGSNHKIERRNNYYKDFELYQVLSPGTVVYRQDSSSGGREKD